MKYFLSLQDNKMNDESRLIESARQADAQVSIAKDVDFKMYLDAVIDASKRSRGLIYILIAIFILMVVTFRNIYMPRWQHQRLLALQLVRLNMESGDAELTKSAESVKQSQTRLLTIRATKEEIESAERYTRTFLFSNEQFDPIANLNPRKRPPEAHPLVDLKGAIVAQQLDFAIQQLLRKRADMTVVDMPLTGVHIDVNDAGVIGGMFLSAVLFILGASFRREAANLRIAIEQAHKRGDQRNLDLLAMAQVLSFASTAGSLTHRGERHLLNLAVHIVVILPLVALYFLCKDDLWDPNGIGDGLIGLVANRWEVALEFVVMIFALCLTTYCCWAKSRLNKECVKLEDEIKAERDTEADAVNNLASAPIANCTLKFLWPSP